MAQENPVANAKPVNKRNTICPQCGANVAVDQFQEHFSGHSKEKLSKEEREQAEKDQKAEEQRQVEAARAQRNANKPPPKLTPQQRKRAVVEAVGGNLQLVIQNALDKIDQEEKGAAQSEEQRKIQTYYQGVSDSFLSGEPVKLEESFEEIPQVPQFGLRDPDVQQMRAQSVDPVYAQSYKLKYNLTRVIEVNKNQSQEIQSLRDSKRDYNESVSFGIAGYAEDHRYIEAEQGRNYGRAIRNWGLIIALIVTAIVLYEYENSPQLQAQVAQFWGNDLNKAIVVIVFIVGAYILYLLSKSRRKRPSGAVS